VETDAQVHAAIMKSWWRSRTLRFRFAVWYGAGGTLLLAAFSATLYFYVAQRVALPLGQELRQDLTEVQRKLQITADGTILWEGNELKSRGRWMTEYPWFEIWDANGRLVRRLWPFSGSRISETPRAPAQGSETISIFYVAHDLRLRSLSAPVRPVGLDRDWTIRVMRLHKPASEALQALRWIIITTLPVVIALLVVGGWIITQRWLAPLASMVAEAKQINADQLARRLPVANARDELGQLATVFNATLDRLESAFSTLDRFVADASHELKTPLATLRSVGEMGLRCSTSLNEASEVISSMLEEAHRLEILVQRLLQLANVEGGPVLAQRSPIALEQCITGIADELRGLAGEKSQSIVIDAAPCVVNTDPVLFRQALHNLVENAIKYGPDRGTIRVATIIDEKEIGISVADEGPGIAPEDRASLMQRFFRPTRGRDRNSGGYGLGLSITKAFMRVLGGSVRYAPREPTGSVFQLILPR
jgi:signal transduction histidine kinase